MGAWVLTHVSWLANMTSVVLDVITSEPAAHCMQVCCCVESFQLIIFYVCQYIAYMVFEQCLQEIFIGCMHVYCLSTLVAYC